MWGIAAVVCLTTGTWLAARRGFPVQRSALALVILAVAVLIGSKALYVIEAAVLPLSDYVPPDARGSLHGFRIPGGMLASLAGLPLGCGVLGLPWREFGDTEAVVLALGVVFIRLGCLMNGCCFGGVSDVPWAMSFPRGTWAFWYHASYGWVGPEANVSLPTHPLQLYFLGAALLTIAILLLLQRRNPLPGRVVLVSTVLFFGTTAAIEPFRANRLILNEWLVCAVAVVSVGLLVGHRARLAATLCGPASSRCP
jgi:phosphatidylglycerol:prolipoprotein diacylglycerol transferase